MKTEPITTESKIGLGGMARQGRAGTTTRKSKRGRPPKGSEEGISEHIIATASRLFAAQGYAATSVEQVAAACGAGKDTIYRRYPSKQALFEGVVEHVRQRTLVRLETAIPQKGDALARLRRVARWFLTINLDPEHVAFKRIAFSEALVVGKAKITTTPDPIMARLTSLVSAAQEAGALKSCDPAFIAGQLILCIATGPSIDAVLGRTTYASVAAQDSYFKKAWSLFVRGAGRS